MKSIIVIMLLLILGTAQAVQAVQTVNKLKSRYGDITITKIVEGNDPKDMLAAINYIIKLNDKIIYQAEYPGLSSVEVIKIFRINDNEVLLVSFWDGGNLNPFRYNFITLNKSGSKMSKVFYAPYHSMIKVKQIDNKLEVNYAYTSKGWNYELTRPPVIFENGEIKFKGKK